MPVCSTATFPPLVAAANGLQQGKRKGRHVYCVRGSSLARSPFPGMGEVRRGGCEAASLFQAGWLRKGEREWGVKRTSSIVRLLFVRLCPPPRPLVRPCLPLPSSPVTNVCTRQKRAEGGRKRTLLLFPSAFLDPPPPTSFLWGLELKKRF